MSTKTLTTTTSIQRTQATSNAPSQTPLKNSDPAENDAINKTIRLRQTGVGGFFRLPVVLLVICYFRQIPFWDRFFSVAFPVYLYLANRFRFDNNAPQIALRKQRGDEFPGHPDFFTVNKESWFPKYMAFAASLGVLLPMLVQFAAPRQVAEATAPHLFLLWDKS
jgi:hypothetical protein